MSHHLRIVRDNVALRYQRLLQRVLGASIDIQDERVSKPALQFQQQRSTSASDLVKALQSELHVPLGLNNKVGVMQHMLDIVLGVGLIADC